MTRKIHTIGKPQKKLPGIMLGRPVAREPMRENQFKFQQAFYQLHQEGYKMYWEDMIGMEWWMKHHSSNRNSICEAFLARKDCDYLIFIDDDMTFKDLAADIKQMIAHDKDMVMGITCAKPSPHHPQIGKVTKLSPTGTITDCLSSNIYTFPEDEIFEADFGSLGLACIKKKVIETMTPPWCYFPPCYQNRKTWGEDVTFFINAKMHGFELWVDPTLQLGHLGVAVWNYKGRIDAWEDYKEDVIKEKEEIGWDTTHNLVPEVQEQFKKGLGPKRFV